MTFTALANIARASLGYKSLQNDFYYLARATVDTYGIEPRFLQPIFMLGDLEGETYFQHSTPELWIFLCRDKEEALQGTGALRYIQAKSEQPAAQRKQSGKARTIREVLRAQGGGLWYAPKARPHSAHLWLRKAFDTVYAPLLFEQASVVDQRCNSIEPVEGVPWELLGAVLTTTVFAYAVEINGSASLGAGALEAPTTRLREYPVFDPRSLHDSERKELIRLARAVWSAEQPMNWRADGLEPGPCLRALDEWVLARARTAVTRERLYSDLRECCRARLHVARDKDRTRKKDKTKSSPERGG